MAALVAALPSSPACAQPILIDFEQFPGMANTSGTSIPAVSRLADQYLASHGVRFSSGSPFVAVVSLGTNHATSGTRGIGGSTPAGALTYSSAFPIIARFLSVAGEEPMVVTQVSIRGDLRPVAGSKTLQAFDVAGALIGTDTLPDIDPSPLTISIPGIHSVRAFSSSGTVAFDDLRFDTPACAAPRFAQHPAARITCPAGAVSLSVAAMGTGPLTYQWQWREAGQAEFRSVVIGSNSTGGGAPPRFFTNAVAEAAIDIRETTAGVDIEFRCVVSNDCGPASVASDAATLNIRDGGYANCDLSTAAPVLNVLDFSCFLNKFAAGDTYANCDHSTTPPVLNVLDFSCFLNQFAAGCS